MSLTAGTRLVQRQLGRMLRSKVAGDDAPARAQRIWGAEGERWFTPADPIWRVHADASMFPAGVASLLLQSLHPLAMAGVAGHSGYKSDPWGRLQRTSHYLATTTFGTIEHAEEAIALVRSIHERVRGRDPLGRDYRASDPHLLRWVHLAEIDSFLRAHQTFGAQPLTDDEADRYVEQTGIPAVRLGVIDPPTTVAGLGEALAGLPSRARGDRRGPRGGPLPAPRAAPAVLRAGRLRHARLGRRLAAPRLGALHARHPAARGRVVPGRPSAGPPRHRRGPLGHGRSRRAAPLRATPGARSQLRAGHPAYRRALHGIQPHGIQCGKRHPRDRGRSCRAAPSR